MTDLELSILVKPYRLVSYVSNDDGYVVWRRGTGDNVEILHLRAYSPGHGQGTRLFGEFLTRLKADPPYCTVFGFSRVSNKDGIKFWRKMGFNLTVVPGVYMDGEAVLFSAEYLKLIKANDVPAQVRYQTL